MVENRVDTVVIAKTGGGKTLIYIMAALLSKKTLVVFEPLVALIQDQQRAINDFKTGLRVAGVVADEDSNKIEKDFLENRLDICI